MPFPLHPVVALRGAVEEFEVAEVHFTLLRDLAGTQVFAMNRSFTAAQGDLEGETKRAAQLVNELEIAQMKLSQFETEVCPFPTPEWADWFGIQSPPGAPEFPSFRITDLNAYVVYVLHVVLGATEGARVPEQH